MARRAATRASAGRTRVTLSQDAPETIRNEVVQWMADELVEEAKAEALRLVPVDTGNLKASIFAYARPLGRQVAALVVGASAPYAKFVEFGTQRRGAATVQTGDVGDITQPSEYVHGQGAGMRAQPFLRPAIWSVMRRYMKVG